MKDGPFGGIKKIAKKSLTKPKKIYTKKIGQGRDSNLLRLQGKLTETLTKLYDGLVDSLRTISISDMSRKGTCKNH